MTNEPSASPCEQTGVVAARTLRIKSMNAPNDGSVLNVDGHVR